MNLRVILHFAFLDHNGRLSHLGHLSNRLCVLLKFKFNNIRRIGQRRTVITDKHIHLCVSVCMYGGCACACIRVSWKKGYTYISCCFQSNGFDATLYYQVASRINIPLNKEMEKAFLFLFLF